MHERMPHLQSLLPDKALRGIEVGPGHNPICPKAGGWQVETVDTVDTEGLRAYLGQDPGNDLSGVETVDHVWTDGKLHELFSPEMYGKYHYIVASHVFEHVPDIISFLQSVEKLLTPDGVLLLVLPDRRLTYDFLKPQTCVADAIEAFEQKRKRHSLKNAYLLYFYTCWYVEFGAWLEPRLPTRFRWSFAESRKMFEEYKDLVKERYVDMHAWVWTPPAFELMMIELQLMNYTQIEMREIQQPIPNEFIVLLQPARQKLQYDAALEQKRFDLSLQSIMYYNNGAEAFVDMNKPQKNPLPGQLERHRRWRRIKDHWREARGHMREIRGHFYLLRQSMRRK